MTTELADPANGCPNAAFSDPASPYHRKQSSSLHALNELCPPSPPLSPSVSINVSKATKVTGEIPIIFDFLTTGSMPSEERISKMANLKPALPPLAKFSPISAFFPMSDSSNTLDTISTQAFGTRRPDSYYSDGSQQRYSMLSDSSGYSPLDTDFNLPSPTSPEKRKDYETCQGLMSMSDSTPNVQVIDYDLGQKEIGDISQFTVSEYLAFPSGHDEVLGTIQSMEAESSVRGHDNILVTRESPPPCERSSSLERKTQVLPTYTGNDLLSIPNSPEFDDKTPTQSTFLKYLPQDNTVRGYPSGASANPEATNSNLRSLSVTEVFTLPAVERASAAGSSLAAPSSLDFDDKTPTQATFLKRQTDAHHLSQPASDRCSQVITLDVPSSAIPDVAMRRLHLEREQQKTGVTKPHSGESGDSTKPDEPTPSLAFPGPVPGNALPVPSLKHAQWLRDTVVELWIDQEGFRAIRPRFYLASISNGLPYSQDQYGPLPPGVMEITEEHDPLYTTVAEFLPVTRTAHPFHHAALDRAPTLTRITTGGDENRDYITRAATLVLRDNGVFFVHGTEDHRVDTERPGPNGSTSSNGGRIIRLNWRFEYFVSNRNSHKGEKLMTPLSFSCTPALLNPSRSIKVKVLHIMKKTLLPNLVAQKLEPPDLPQLHTRASNSSLASVTSIARSESRTSVSSTKSITKTRARTRRPSESEQVINININPTHSHSFILPRLKPPPRPPLSSTKHRRGSHSDTTPEDFMRGRLSAANAFSAHERSRSASTLGHREDVNVNAITTVNMNEAGLNRTPSFNGNNTPPLIGPIMPPEELMKLCDSEVEGRRRPHSVRVEVVDNVPVTTLPAAPRHKHYS